MIFMSKAQKFNNVCFRLYLNKNQQTADIQGGESSVLNNFLL